MAAVSMSNLYRLSKSRYCRGIQCPKMLWLEKNKPEEVEKIRASLLKYCGLDTYAMVKVLAKLRDNVNK